MNSGKRAYFIFSIFFGIGLLMNTALAQTNPPNLNQARLEKVYKQLPEMYQGHVKLFSERKFRQKFQESDLEIDDLGTLRSAFMRLPVEYQLNIIHFAERKFRVFVMDNNGKQVFERLEESMPTKRANHHPAEHH